MTKRDGMRRVMLVLACALCMDALAASDEVATNRSCDQWGSTDFFETADVATVARCLETRDPNETRDGVPAWFGAARRSSDPNVVRMLIEAGADTAANDGDGNSALHAAVISNRHPAVLAALVAAGVDVSVKNKRGALPVQYAALRDDGPQALKVLLEGGADATARAGNGRTLLHLAARANKNVEVLRFLLKNGADPRARTDNGDTPLHVAVQYSEDAAIVRALLSGMADPDARAEDGDAPLHRLQMREYREFDDVERERRFLDQSVAIAEALLEAGANPNAGDADGRQPLGLMARACRSRGDRRCSLMAAAFIDAGADLEDGFLLVTAARKQDAEFVQLLLAGGVARERDAAALRQAAWMGDDLVVIDVLLGAGVDVEAQDSILETTALHYAAQREDGGQMTRRLVRWGANLEARDNSGRTPLHHAAAWDVHEGLHAGESLVALLDAGADPLAMDEDGRTPWDLAKENEALKGSKAYGRLDDARFASMPATGDEGVDPNSRCGAIPNPGPDNFGSECWLATSNLPGCHIWLRHPSIGRTYSVVWTGSCFHGKADGAGKESLTIRSERSSTTHENEGTYAGGKRHGFWRVRYVSNGWLHEGNYDQGIQVGEWTMHYTEGPHRGKSFSFDCGTPDRARCSFTIRAPVTH